MAGLRQRVEAGEDAVGQALAAQLRVSDSARLGLSQVEAQQRGVEPDSPAGQRLTVLRELYTAALVFSDDADHAGPLLSEAAERMERHQHLSQVEQLSRATDALSHGISEALSREGFDVHTVDDGNQVMNLCLELRPTVLVLDIMMPGMDGFEVLRGWRGTPRCAPAARPSSGWPADTGSSRSSTGRCG